MDALVVYESIFGNGRTIAEAVAEGLTPRLDTRAIDVAAAPRWLDVDLVVVGGPNHHFGLSTRDSRDEAAEHGETLMLPRIGLREWLEVMRRGSASLVAAAYDTRLARPRFAEPWDHASRTITRRLRGRGIGVISSAQHFYVVDMAGPLQAGEVERARTWGTALARATARHAMTSR